MSAKKPSAVSGQLSAISPKHKQRTAEVEGVPEPGCIELPVRLATQPGGLVDVNVGSWTARVRAGDLLLAVKSIVEGK